MFNPNVQVKVSRRSGRDLYGKAAYAAGVMVPACVVKLPTSDKKTSVRADSSASRGAAVEQEADTRFLLTPTAQIAQGDLIEFWGKSYQVQVVHPRFDVFSRLDHIQVDCGAWVA